MSTTLTITGNLTRDPDLKFSKAGKAWATFTVASNSGKDGNEKTTFQDVKVFGELAEGCTESLTKGTRVIVSGHLDTEEWESDGQKRSKNVLVARAVGPDLRWATAKVTKTTRPNPTNRLPETSQTDDPWGNVPPVDQEPGW